MTFTCPKTAPSGGPFRAADWARFAPGEIRFRSERSRTIQPGSGQNGSAFDPAFGSGACATVPAADDSTGATYRLPEAPAGGFTLMGSPTVIANFGETDSNSQVAARLLDVAPDETETLVARGLWRPAVGRDSESQVFQLHPDGYHFEAGHIAKIELIAADSPYGRASNGQQPITVSNLEVRLPVLERPGTGRGFVKAPARKIVPKGYELAEDFKRLSSPAAKPERRVRLHGSRLVTRIRCPKSWGSCNRGLVVVHGAGKSSKRFAGKTRFRRIGGGRTRVVAIHLRGWARRYLRSRSRPTVRITVRTAERAESVIVARQVK